MQVSHTLHYEAQGKKLTIRNATEFPSEILNYPDVEILDMSYGHLTSLPESIGELTKLRVAFFSHHDFETIPEVLSQCSSLELIGFRSCKIKSFSDHALPKHIKGIILTDNQIVSLPASIGTYTHLKKLMLSGNALKTIPDAIADCHNLELLRLSVNHLDKFPEAILELPKLSWYSDAGNPMFRGDSYKNNDTKEIDWHDIQLGEKIGESASNKVYRGRLKDEEVAVKIYGSSLSTDGLAMDDMHACLLAGSHDHIIGGMGKVINTPQNAHALVMPLIRDAFHKLGNPPDFTTFTRDVFPDHTFSLSYILRVLTDIASAMSHCHKKGIMHGDLYAHNILTNTQGESYLGDFGAASLYEPNSIEGRLREKIDVSGFGCLIEDLLGNCEVEEKNTLQNHIHKLMHHCLDQKIENRLTFQEIQDYLENQIH